MPMQLIAPVVVFLGVLVFFFGLRSMLQRNEEIEARLDRLAQTNRIGMAAAAELRGRTEARMTQQLTGNLNKAIAKQTFAQNLATGLARADLKMTPAEFLILRLIISVVVGVIGYFIAVIRQAGPPPLLGIVGFVIGYWAVGFWLRRRQARRLKAFNDQLADTLVLVANSLRSG